ncbi:MULTISPECIES: DMT family transporter [unclassified Sphingomonas]|jgi:drug/metabolite transporter (DMT)-like permease|uniref:DMT family transporter n=1 Tax=unclassified Sphingomonas TaxID=196159 RepID=UPI0025CE1643|nr:MULTISPECIES: DMT family transporter [unclassified Sphingomonas]
MTLASLLLIVLAAVTHAIWNLLAKRAASVGPVFVFAYNLVACIGYAPSVLYLLSGGTVGWTAGGVAVVLLSGVIHLAYSLCLQRGYQVADLSVIYPVARGTGPMLSTIGAILLLGEVPSGRSLGGLALVVIGIGLIATRGDLSAFRRPGGQSGVRWGAATGGLIASYTVVDAHAVKALSIMPVILDWFSNLLRFALLAPIVGANPRRAIHAMKGYWWLAIGVGLLSPLSYILVLAALRNGAPLSLVAPMREMSMMVGAVLAMVILREAVGIWRLAGCGVLIVGVIALAGA